MSRTQFLTIALALVVSSTSVAAETPANPVAATEASPAPSQPEAMPASPAAPVAEAPAAQKKSIVLGPEGVDDEGRVGRLHTVTRGDTLWDVSAAYLGTPWVWPSVWIDNHDIANPHLIRLFECANTPSRSVRLGITGVKGEPSAMPGQFPDVGKGRCLRERRRSTRL